MTVKYFITEFENLCPAWLLGGINWYVKNQESNYKLETQYDIEDMAKMVQIPGMTESMTWVWDLMQRIYNSNEQNPKYKGKTTEQILATLKSEWPEEYKAFPNLWRTMEIWTWG